MTLPFDPAAVSAGDVGEKRATLEMDHEAAVEHVRETFLEHGFGVPVEFSPSELLNEKVDREARSRSRAEGSRDDETRGVSNHASSSRTQSDDAGRDPYYVLGACNPGMADRALDATDGRIGALFPCNVVVWREEPGVQTVYHVSIVRIARLLGLDADADAMDDIVAETGRMVEAAYGDLDSV